MHTSFPQDRTQGIDGFPPPEVVGAKRDVTDMRSQLFDDFFHIPHLLRREKRVVQQPVIGFTVFKFIAEQINGRIQQFQHLMTALLNNDDVR